MPKELENLENSMPLTKEQGYTHDPTEMSHYQFQSFVRGTRKELFSFPGTGTCGIIKFGEIHNYSLKTVGLKMQEGEKSIRTFLMLVYLQTFSLINQ